MHRPIPDACVGKYGGPHQNSFPIKPEEMEYKHVSYIVHMCHYQKR